ncbi:TlyA family RNA methyltransferase [Christensenellaceae bacterium 44-20]
MEKERLDILIVKKGLAPSREKAKALVLSGQVLAGGRVASKVGETFPCDTEISIKGNTCPYVSRGGLKLEKAMAEFGISLKEKTCMDIGASTGGFTDCMLQNGAARVYAVDVGYGQLDWALRNNEKVVVMERTNARYLAQEDVPEQPDFASVDVSFISLRLILPALERLKVREVVTLIKPQFEAGRENVGKKGVVRDPAVHLEVIAGVLDFANEIGYAVQHLSYSPIKGPNGNIEYLAHYLLGAEAALVEPNAVVQQAHAAL